MFNWLMEKLDFEVIFKWIIIGIIVVVVIGAIWMVIEHFETRKRNSHYEPRIRPKIRKRIETLRKKTDLARKQPQNECCVCRGAGKRLRGGSFHRGSITVDLFSARDDQLVLALDEKECDKAIGRSNEILYLEICYYCKGSGIHKKVKKVARHEKKEGEPRERPNNYSGYRCCECGKTSEEAHEAGTELVKCAASGFVGSNPDHWFCLSHPHTVVGLSSNPVCSHQCWLDWD